mmetsp:Transcript_841/g.3488  ORF Transcript_841/g.3488 Transcript_841/m.3488 type:complete len:304 (-) Transcript_841:771-1682(-)
MAARISPSTDSSIMARSMRTQLCCLRMVRGSLAPGILRRKGSRVTSSQARHNNGVLRAGGVRKRRREAPVSERLQRLRLRLRGCRRGDRRGRARRVGSRTTAREEQAAAPVGTRPFRPRGQAPGLPDAPDGQAGVHAVRADEAGGGGRVRRGGAARARGEAQGVRDGLVRAQEVQGGRDRREGTEDERGVDGGRGEGAQERRARGRRRARDGGARRGTQAHAGRETEAAGVGGDGRGRVPRQGTRRARAEEEGRERLDGRRTAEATGWTERARQRGVEERGGDGAPPAVRLSARRAPSLGGVW